MSLKPSGLIEGWMSEEGMAVVIDDHPDSEQVLIIPASFEHRQVWQRKQLNQFIAANNLHPANNSQFKQQLKQQIAAQEKDSPLLPGLLKALQMLE